MGHHHDNHYRNAAFICLLLFATHIVWPRAGFTDDPISIHGYYKTFFVVFDLPQLIAPFPLPAQPLRGAVDNRFRFKLGYAPTPWLASDVAYDFSPQVRDPLLFTEQIIFIGINPTRYRAIDFNSRLYPAVGDSIGSFGIFHNLDRAVVTLKTSPVDILIGRQVVAWGSARVLNPTDVIAPFTFEELDKEERFGVDAVRLRMPLGALTEIDAGYIFGKDFRFEESAFFVRHKFYTAKTDIALLLLGFRNHLLVGFDLARALGGAGLWFEAAQVLTQVFNEHPTGEKKHYFRGTAGFDYSFSGKTYGFIEYHYNGAGANQPQHYWANLSTPAYLDGAVYLFGKHYVVPGLVYQLSPLVTFSSQALWNLSDWSLNWALRVEYNLAQNIHLAAGTLMGFGKNPEIAISPLGLRFHSEFGAYPDIYFSSFRIYF
ncbi:MAG: hypothetical protein ONA90_07820 [candidate division KSB1 bacterium]|nr:hypothetical protein [candidate division KSB1 bacterium]